MFSKKIKTLSLLTLAVLFVYSSAATAESSVKVPPGIVEMQSSLDNLG